MATLQFAYPGQLFLYEYLSKERRPQETPATTQADSHLASSAEGGGRGQSTPTGP